MSRLTSSIWQMVKNTHKAAREFVGEDIDGFESYEADKFVDFIAREVLKARLDELKHLVSGSEYADDDIDWYEISRQEYTGTQYYSEVKHMNMAERIAELEAELEKMG